MEMQRIAASVAMPSAFETMMHYPFGWVDAEGQPYQERTGKRIRPILLLSCVKAADGKWQDALPAAAAVEILHNFSLVHDDIQDNSDIRHGRDTVWRIWGVPMAINAGDALFVMSYRAVEMLRAQGLPDTTVLDVFETYNATVFELTRGQYLDMHFETQENVTVESYVSMVGGKTAALLAGCAKIGALIAGSSMKTADLYSDFGLNMGIAFQIRDDILGIWGDASETGKSAATDIQYRKKSVPILYGLDRSERLREIYAAEQIDDRDVSEAITILESVGAKDYALESEKTYYNRSISALDAATPTENGREELIGLVDALFKRSH
ncbi:MAG: polyprenyl synthetase family protein, partial [Chloroflexota bacterium]